MALSQFNNRLSGSMGSSWQQPLELSGDTPSQPSEGLGPDDLGSPGSPTPIGSTWEPTKIRAKVGGSYWVVENDKKCVAFCKMQMSVYPLPILANYARLRMRRRFAGLLSPRSCPRFGQSSLRFFNLEHHLEPMRWPMFSATIVARSCPTQTATPKRVPQECRNT
jgi:hypothetical protein